MCQACKQRSHRSGFDHRRSDCSRVDWQLYETRYGYSSALKMSLWSTAKRSTLVFKSQYIAVFSRIILAIGKNSDLPFDTGHWWPARSLVKGRVTTDVARLALTVHLCFECEPNLSGNIACASNAAIYWPWRAAFFTLRWRDSDGPNPACSAETCGDGGSFRKLWIAGNWLMLSCTVISLSKLQNGSPSTLHKYILSCCSGLFVVQVSTE